MQTSQPNDLDQSVSTEAEKSVPEVLCEGKPFFKKAKTICALITPSLILQFEERFGRSFNKIIISAGKRNEIAPKGDILEIRGQNPEQVVKLIKKEEKKISSPKRSLKQNRLESLRHVVIKLCNSEQHETRGYIDADALDACLKTLLSFNAADATSKERKMYSQVLSETSNRTVSISPKSKLIITLLGESENSKKVIAAKNSVIKALFSYLSEKGQLDRWLRSTQKDLQGVIQALQAGKLHCTPDTFKRIENSIKEVSGLRAVQDQDSWASFEKILTPLLDEVHFQLQETIGVALARNEEQAKKDCMDFASNIANLLATQYPPEFAATSIDLQFRQQYETSLSMPNFLHESEKIHNSILENENFVSPKEEPSFIKYFRSSKEKKDFPLAGDLSQLLRSFAALYKYCSEGEKNLFHDTAEYLPFNDSPSSSAEDFIYSFALMQINTLERKGSSTLIIREEGSLDILINAILQAVFFKERVQFEKALSGESDAGVIGAIHNLQKMKKLAVLADDTSPITKAQDMAESECISVLSEYTDYEFSSSLGMIGGTVECTEEAAYVAWRSLPEKLSEFQGYCKVWVEGETLPAERIDSLAKQITHTRKFFQNTLNSGPYKKYSRLLVKELETLTAKLAGTLEQLEQNRNVAESINACREPLNELRGILTHWSPLFSRIRDQRKNLLELKRRALKVMTMAP